MDKGKIVYAKGYGVTAPDGKTRVTTETLFLAGSISKSVSAVGALKLVEAGTLSLDQNVNEKLTTWKVPDNAAFGTEKVTLRRILSHTAGPDSAWIRRVRGGDAGTDADADPRWFAAGQQPAGAH